MNVSVFVLCIGIICNIKEIYSDTLDVVIVADSTDFVGYIDWALERTVMSNALTALKIGICNVRILGLVRYARKIDVISPLGNIETQDNDNIDESIDSVELLEGDYADLAGALRTAAKVFDGCYDRPNVPNLVIVVTSSSNSTVEEVQIASEELREVASICTYGMEVGNRIKEEHINVMANGRKFKLQYDMYYDAVHLFKYLTESSPKRECGYIECRECPSNYKQAELKYSATTFFSVIKKRADLTDRSYLANSGSFITLVELQNIVICKPFTNIKIVSFGKIRLQDLVSFKFHQLCMETVNVEEITVAANRGSITKRNPKYKVEIKPELRGDWHKTCIETSTYYTWKKVKVNFKMSKPDENKIGQFWVRNLYMDGCVPRKYMDL